MNRLEIRTESRRIMAETSTTASYASETDLNKWINAGLEDMTTKGKVYQKTETATITNGVPTYTLPWDFIELEAVTNPAGGTLDIISVTSAGRVYIIAGKPLYCYITQTPITSAVRVNLTAYTQGKFLIPATPNGFMYEVTTAGTTAAAPPTFPTDESATVTDGSCVLTCREYMTEIWGITFVDTPTTVGGGTGTYAITYFALVQGLANDVDSPPFPVEKHRYLIPYVCYRWSIKNRDAQLAAAFYQEYAAGVGLPMTQPQGGQGAS